LCQSQGLSYFLSITSANRLTPDLVQWWIFPIVFPSNLSSFKVEFVCR